jgi:bifunctional non-homologous end joining protein LigD
MKALSNYRKRRDFNRTSEPTGALPSSKRGKALRKASTELAFVVQKHDASRLHYDFRLELDGVLLSWAIPKGPSLDPEVKRLAVEVEPHPLEYGNFEGTIPKGEYGGGTVMVWDRGSWRPEGDARRALARGHLKFTLQGEKLTGAWHLVRTKAANSANNGGKAWLLFKSRDASAQSGQELPQDDVSALSGRDLAQIAANDRGARLPATLEPELATLVDMPPSGAEWLHEIKLDGYRIVARIDTGQVRLLTRSGNDWSERMPDLRDTLARLPVQALLDGELVALDEHGVSKFQTLQNSLSEGADAALSYYVFDLLHLDGRDLSRLPLVERKAELRRLLERYAGELGSKVRISDHVVGNGPEFFQRACKLGLEGTIAKRASSAYRSGRGRDWLKIKCTQRQELAIVGFTEPSGSRSHLGALLLGAERDGELRYAGRVGTGFSEASLKELAKKLKPLTTKVSPLANPPRGAMARGVHWVRPKLAAQVRFSEVTTDGLLRHPSFEGLREDKPAASVQIETAAPLPPPQAGYVLSNPNKVLYPELGITKQELLDYYALVAERILPHVANRPLTLLRCPNGREKCFFQKHPGTGSVPGLRSVAIEEKNGKAPYSVLDDANGLFALVQLGALEIHTWGSRADDYERPDILVFDLDPDPALDYAAVVRGALRVRQVLEQAKLESFVKTTGGKGLHICAPLAQGSSWEQAKAFSRHVAEVIAADAPSLYLATASKAKRKGKTFIDYLRNARGATFVAPYSTRARENAPVATPLEWDELTPKLKPNQFTLRNLPQRLAKLRHDPFERLLRLEQRLPKEGA